MTAQSTGSLANTGNEYAARRLNQVIMLNIGSLCMVLPVILLLSITVSLEQGRLTDQSVMISQQPKSSHFGDPSFFAASEPADQGEVRVHMCWYRTNGWSKA